jgi:C4-dicarboxylate-specific signal transduction histidine kinase
MRGDAVASNVDHIKQIVAMQQSYAKVSGVMETLDPAELIENALLMHRGALARHQVEVVCDFEKVPSITVDKHKVLQILINVIGNAKYAMDDNDPAQKILRVRLEHTTENHVAISISDNGVGIPNENLSRIFQHGFTTKRNGHGFGLHSSAIAAKQLGGSLIAHSEGEGHGATFLLKLPVTPDAVQTSCDMKDSSLFTALA